MLTLLVLALTSQTLHAHAFEPLPTGAITPKGWLEAQLRTQADGLSGHLDEFWPDIKDSAWFGGAAEGWERVPYWLDGLIPLAYQLDDERLKAKVKKAVDTILDHQQPDGWLGPIGDNNPRHKPYDVWPLFPLFKALIQYQEATGDPRVIPALLKCAHKIDQVITQEPLYSWAHYRAADLAAPLYWLHDKTKDPTLLALAKKALEQAYDWRVHFENFEAKYSEKTTQFGLDNHGVNNGMALKFGPVRALLSGDETDKSLAAFALARLDRFHGQATGIFTCDEHYAGRSPSQGTELCTVAEAMYSLALAASITGETQYADRLERLAYNALPATFKKDMTAHQYDQQCNQVICTREGEHVYTNNGPDSNLYGLEPNFGCCTANMHQAWPKFVSHLWMKTADNAGLAAIAYAPCRVRTKVADTPVTIDVKTHYPFRDVVTITVATDRPTRFPLRLRIPTWAEKTHVLFKNSTQTFDGVRIEAPADGALSTIQKGGYFVDIDAEWAGETTFVVEFRSPVTAYKGDNDAVALLRGPLVYALNIEADWKLVNDRKDLPFDDWEVLPKSDWNFALSIDPQNPSASAAFENERVEDPAFAPGKAGLSLTVKARKLPSWTIEKSAAATPPQSPVNSDEPEQTLKLVPYGTTDLRITEFPRLK